MAKDKTYKRLINSTRWLRLRKEVLGSRPLCQRCLEQGRVTAACEVHHIRPVEEAASKTEKERRMFDPSNLRALCHSCHVETHTEMGRCGKEANGKRIETQKEEYIKKFFGENK